MERLYKHELADPKLVAVQPEINANSVDYRTIRLEKKRYITNILYTNKILLQFNNNSSLILF